MRYGWKVSTYASHENGQTEVPQEDAKRYARAFGVSAGWILTGEGAAEPIARNGSGPRDLVDVYGYVGAGAKIIPFDDSNAIDQVELPSADDDLGCVIVRGDSMHPRYFDGEKLFYKRQRFSPSQLVGQECVIHLTNGQVLIKIIRRGSRKSAFHLESWNAPLLEDQSIEWASPVQWRG